MFTLWLVCLDGELTSGCTTQELFVVHTGPTILVACMLLARKKICGVHLLTEYPPPPLANSPPLQSPPPPTRETVTSMFF